MAHAILMPRPGQATEECTVVAWHKQEGDPVHRGDVLFEIETDKSNMDVEAFDDGVLLRIVVPAGMTVPVNAICAYIGAPGEAIPDVAPPSPMPSGAPLAEPVAASGSAATAESAAPSSPAAKVQSAPKVAAPPIAATPAPTLRGRLAISPRASRLAAEAGVDPRTVVGTGPDGRIVERDVEAAIAAATPVATPEVNPDGEDAPRQMSRMRRVIADRLTTSWTTTPHYTVTVAVEMTNVFALRGRLKDAGTSLTVTDFVLAATADTLAEFPDVNSRTDGVSVWPRRHVHLGVAVAVPDGLLVPVIRDADRLTVGEIHDRAASLATAARAGTASVDDLTGSTFTVSNLGMLGVEEFSAIINPGEAAILAVSAAIPTPVAVGGAVEVRPVMKLTLSADHRLVDGAAGARFLGALKGRLEDAASFRVAAPDAGRSTGTDAQISPQVASAVGRVARIDGPDSFDLVVLGAGTGGYTAAFRAAQLGLKVALVDVDRIGGTCLHRGCIPTKAILESASLAHRVRHDGDRLGVRASDLTIDYAAVAENKDQVVARMWTGLKSLVGKNHVEWVSGRGRLDGPGRVRVQLHGADGAPGAGGERVLTATDVILATGSRVKSLPGIVPDGRRILTSDDVLRMTELPASIVIVGAGAVGSEFASAFHDLGVAVTLLEYLPSIVPLEDHAVSTALQRAFERRRIRVITNARFDVASLVADSDGISLSVGPDGAEPAAIRAECVLIATGRAANIEDIGLETTRVRVDRGIVEVDGYMRTAEPHVYAIGDVVGGLWLAHTAAHEGLIAAHTIAGDGVHPMDYDAQPRATYTRPEVASIGLTEQACAERGLPIAIGKVPFTAIAKAVIEGDADGFAKVIAHRDTGVVLGLHIIGPHATELIAEGSLAATLDAAAATLAAATHPHPTLSEVIGEAAMAVDGRSINF
jgi:dihydrolipoamide dehydrogenase